MAYGQGSLTLDRALAGTTITARQVGHWVSKGWVKARGETGSGYTNEYDQHELAVMRRMAQLVHAGFRPEPAAHVARRSVNQGTDQITDDDTGITVIFKEA